MDRTLARQPSRLATCGALLAWSYVVWVLLTWTLTVENLVVGLAVSAAVAAALTPFGGARGPVWMLSPRRLSAIVALTARSTVMMVSANLRLAARIWRPSRPLKSGMVIVPTLQRSPGGLTTVGVLTSLIVDNQVVDVDRARHELLYHTVEVAADRQSAYETINGPVEEYLGLVTGKHQHG